MPRKRFGDDDDYDEAPRRKKIRRSSRSDNTGLIVGLVLGGVFLIVVAVGAAVLLGRGNRDQERRQSVEQLDPREDATIRVLQSFEPPANWSHKDLADHLGGKGLRVEVREDASLSTRHGRGAWFEDPTRKTTFLKVPRPPRVRVYLCADVRSTHRQCVAVEQEGGPIPFIVGRFVVGAPVMTRDDQSCDNADIELRDRIRDALERGGAPKK